MGPQWNYSCQGLPRTNAFFFSLGGKYNFILTIGIKLLHRVRTPWDSFPFVSFNKYKWIKILYFAKGSPLFLLQISWKPHGQQLTWPQAHSSGTHPAHLPHNQILLSLERVRLTHLPANTLYVQHLPFLHPLPSTKSSYWIWTFKWFPPEKERIWSPQKTFNQYHLTPRNQWSFSKTDSSCPQVLYGRERTTQSEIYCMSCRPPLISTIETLFTCNLFETGQMFDPACSRSVIAWNRALDRGWAAHAGEIQTTSQSWTTAECTPHAATLSSMLPQAPVRSRMMHAVCSAPFPSQAAKNSFVPTYSCCSHHVQKLRIPSL